MRISTRLERPTVSIQNGRPICLRDLLRQRLVEQREERLRPDRRQLGRGQEIDHQAKPLLRDAAQLGVVAILRQSSVQIDQRRDVLGHRRGEAPRHRVPVPLHENEGDHRLQDHHRGDDDEQRAGIEALGQHALDPAGRCAPSRRPAGLPRVRSRVMPMSRLVMSAPSGDSRCRARSAGTADWPDRSRSCGAAD